MSREEYIYGMNHKNILLINQKPELNNYLSSWLSYCEAHSIEYGLPKVNVNEDFLDFEDFLWIPSIGLCALYYPQGQWHFREPFARLGVHTCKIHFWQINPIILAREIDASTLNKIHTHANIRVLTTKHSWQVDYCWGILPIFQNRWSKTSQTKWERDLAEVFCERLEERDFFQSIGTLCWFEIAPAPVKRRRGFSKWAKKNQFYGAIHRSYDFQELLSLEVMKSITETIAKPQEVGFLSPPPSEPEPKKPWWDYDEWPVDE